MVSSQRSLPAPLFCRDCGLLTDDQSLVQAPLLRFNHFLILKKGRCYLAIELLGRLGVVLPVAIRRRPEIEAAGLGLWCQTVEQTKLEAKVALWVVGCGAGVSGTRPL